MQQSKEHQLITASPLFQQLTSAETTTVLECLQRLRYEPGTIIIERGTWHGRLYIVASGLVSVLLQDASTLQGQITSQQTEQSEYQPYRVATLGAGECFGEMSLLTGELPTATIRAEQETELWSLSHADFLALTATCPTLLRNMNAILSQRLAYTNQQLLLNRAGEVLLLETIDQQNASPPRALAYHIAELLVQRSQQRVLLVELCSSAEAHALHFATHAQQIRPTLLDCATDTTQLQPHRVPLRTSDDRPLLALTTLTTTPEQLTTLTGNLHATFLELIMHYDYIILSLTSSTPTHTLDLILQQREVQPQRALILLAATDLSHAFSESRIAKQVTSPLLFAVHVVNKPTLGLQDSYSQALQQPLKRLIPADDALLERCWQQQRSLQQLAPHAELTRGIDFIARCIARQTVGIAFGGGGARGFAHLGVLAGLLEHEVPLDYIAGCSIGIMVPGMHLLGKSLEESEQMFLEIQQHLGRWQLSRTSLFSNRGLKTLLHRACGEIHFEDLSTPFAMVAADLSTRAGVVLDHGPIWQAALASVALPGIFPPVLMGKHILVDAGMHDPVPVRLVRHMGADILLASELGGQEPPSLVNAATWQDADPVPEKPSIVDLLLRSYDLAMATVGMYSIREADIVIRPKLHRVSLRQFSEGRSFIASGRDMLEQVIPQIRQRLPSIS